MGTVADRRHQGKLFLFSKEGEKEAERLEEEEEMDEEEEEEEEKKEEPCLKVRRGTAFRRDVINQQASGKQILLQMFTRQTSLQALVQINYHPSQDASP